MTPVSLTLDQMIQLARVGFPEHVKAYTNFGELDAEMSRGVNRLYYPVTPFAMSVSRMSILVIDVRAQDGKIVHIHIDAGTKGINHLSVVREILKMKPHQHEHNV